ncbi:MAG: amino acid ABC transporter ATP-binding protein [Acidobacteria bacterium]|nr:amino acid ABC transporter ATP-binding protein [Acidobacteriota bacterium]
MVEREKVITGPLDKIGILEPLLVLDNVSQEFTLNTGAKFPVLKNLSMSIKNIESKPQIVSILGPSGIGKTTILRIVAGLDRPTSGRVLITEDKPNIMRDIRIGDVGVVFQKYPLFDDLSVLENLIQPAIRVAKLDAKTARERAMQYLDQFGLFDQSLSWPVQLSGGQRQRVALLQQLITNKYFIILDEPFSGLDPVSISSAIKLITDIANQHTLNTFIIITHDITSALIISDTVYLLGRDRNEKGEIIPGAKIIKTYDLIQEGVAYQRNIEDLPRFTEIRKEIKLDIFPKL